MACANKGIATFLANARLSERSAQGYQRIRALVTPALGLLSGIAAQTGQDGARLERLGARNVQITGNLKFDVSHSADTTLLAQDLRRCYQGKFVFLAASTRDGEEAILLDGFSRLARPDILLVIVPRHPQRFDEVGRLIEARGWTWGRRSKPQSDQSDIRVFLGDSMGEMAADYATADMAYIGGSLMPFGGQNLIEAAAVGCPALIGPHTWNFEEAAEQAVSEGSAIRVENSEALISAVRMLRDDEPRRNAMAEAGRRFAAANRGATERVMKMIEAGLSE